MSANEIDVVWSGRYPNLCSGSWEISINKQIIVDNTKEQNQYDNFLTSSMSTEGIYESVGFDNNYEVIHESYEEGYDFNEWKDLLDTKKLFWTIADNGIELSYEDKRILFEKIQEKDWRSGSCGGCL